MRSGAVQERVEARAYHKYGFARAPTGSTVGPFFPGGGPPPWRKAMNRAAPACALLAATACGCASLAHLLLYAAELHPRVREALLAQPRPP